MVASCGPRVCLDVVAEDQVAESCSVASYRVVSAVKPAHMAVVAAYQAVASYFAASEVAAEIVVAVVVAPAAVDAVAGIRKAVAVEEDKTSAAVEVAAAHGDNLAGEGSSVVAGSCCS